MTWGSMKNDLTQNIIGLLVLAMIHTRIACLSCFVIKLSGHICYQYKQKTIILVVTG